ncbi:MCE family protein [Nocardia alni]|uniref:MCE family protein n=1 Tax=Nocardia alni TaxID=2815723 RepID=UPI0027E06312|nr:MCE family protein [Nocardia alni]
MKRIVNRVFGFGLRARLPMRERNRVRIGIVGSLIVLVLLAAVFEYRSLPGIDSGSTYHAEFADASGLYAKDDVQVAGVVVGQVKDVGLSGDHVDVEFSGDFHGVVLGGRTRASIKVATLLGKRFLELTSAGDGRLNPGATIPLSRTTSGYDISESLAEVSNTVAQTNKQQLSAALDKAGELLRTSAPDLGSSVTALGRLSDTVASRDQAVQDLLTHANGVSAILSKRNQQFVLLLADGRSFFDALNSRAVQIHAVLIRATQVFDELSAVARDNSATIGPALSELGRTIDTLNKNYQNINASISGLSNFVTQLSDVVASGPFFNVLLDNITPANLNDPRPGPAGGAR